MLAKPRALRKRESKVDNDTICLEQVGNVYIISVSAEFEDMSTFYSLDKEWATGLFKDFVEKGYFETMRREDLKYP